MLGPILFLVFINDLDEAADMVSVLKKFADDTKLGQTVGTQQGRAALQHALDNLCKWADTWCMKFNVSKCRVMHIGHGNQNQVYTMNGEPLTCVDEEVDIGVKVTKSLKPSAQCLKAAKTAQQVLAQLTRAFHYRDRNVFMRLYTQYVRPHLEFSAPAWSPWTEHDIECLEKVQKRAVNMVSGLKGNSYEDKLVELDMVTLKERRHQMDMLQAYKIVKGKDRVSKDTWFSMASENVNRVTRSAADPLSMRIPAPRLEVRRNFFSQRVPALWNKVPAQIREAETPRAFSGAYFAHCRALAVAARAEQG